MFEAEHEVQCRKLSLSSEATTGSSSSIENDVNTGTGIKVLDRVGDESSPAERPLVNTTQGMKSRDPTQDQNSVLCNELKTVGTATENDSKQIVDESLSRVSDSGAQQLARATKETVPSICDVDSKIVTEVMKCSDDGDKKPLVISTSKPAENPFSTADLVEIDSKHVDEMFAFITDKNHSEYQGNDTESIMDELFLTHPNDIIMNNSVNQMNKANDEMNYSLNKELHMTHTDQFDESKEVKKTVRFLN